MRARVVEAPVRSRWAWSASGAGRLLIALGGLIAAVACVGEPGTGSRETAAEEVAFEIEAEALLSVGVLSGNTPQELDRVISPFVLPDGRLVVPLAGSRELRVFSAQGDFLERLGRRGEGPGEFRSLSAAWPRGDTIEALDGALRRVTRFLPDGSVAVIPIMSGFLRDLSSAAGPLGRGWALGGVASGGRGARDVLAYHHVDRDGSHLGELASSGGIIRYAAGNYGGPEPMSPRSVFASDGTRLYVGDTLNPLVRGVLAPGVVDVEITWEPTESGSADSAFDQVVEEAVSRAGPELAEETRQRLRAAPVPTQLSVFWDFLLDPQGYIWIQPYQPLAHSFALGARYLGGVGSGGTWWVVTRDGRLAGSVGVPEGLEVTQITTTAVVGIRRDGLGVETVHVHRVSRGS